LLRSGFQPDARQMADAAAAETFQLLHCGAAQATRLLIVH
jgi:hypothetical protein